MTELRTSCVAPSIAQVQSRFLTILPRIQTHASIYFRHVSDSQRRADLIAEVVGLSWRWFLELARRGKDASKFSSVLASFAAKAVRIGRRVCGQERAKDAMSTVAQRRHGFSVGKLPDISTLSENPLMEALTDNTQSPVPDQVQFRCDFPAWRRTRTQRDRRIIGSMMAGEGTRCLSRQFGISPSRISQLRREFKTDWHKFCEPRHGHATKASVTTADSTIISAGIVAPQRD
jgi:hypothetical protein